MNAFILAITILAQTLNPGTSPTAEMWAKTLEESSALLREKQFDKAQKRLEKLKDDMLNRIGPGEAADRMFAVTLGQLAVAQAGAGNKELAIWNWHVAQNLHPAMREVDLSMYGETGQMLKDNLLAPKPETCAKPMKAPQVTKRLEPKYPEGVRRFRESGILIVQIRVDSEGHPHEPQVLKALPAPIVWSALDALRRWEFTPAQAGEQLQFCVTFNFKLR